MNYLKELIARLGKALRGKTSVQASSARESHAHEPIASPEPAPAGTGVPSVTPSVSNE